MLRELQGREGRPGQAGGREEPAARAHLGRRLGHRTARVHLASAFSLSSLSSLSSLLVFRSSLPSSHRLFSCSLSRSPASRLSSLVSRLSSVLCPLVMSAQPLPLASPVSRPSAHLIASPLFRSNQPLPASAYIAPSRLSRLSRRSSLLSAVFASPLFMPTQPLPACRLSSLVSRLSSLVSPLPSCYVHSISACI